MDIILDTCDDLFYDQIYTHFPTYLQPYLTRDSIYRQSISLYFIALVGVNILYFALSSLSYFFLYDKTLMTHPKFLKNQVWLEIKMSVTSFPITAIVTVPWFLFEVRGYSKLYHGNEYGTSYFLLSILWFILFTDFGVYWIHRFEHHPLLYSWLHKPHHRWKISTPFASFAFHPLDGYFQSLPMHIFVYLFPMNSYAYIIGFVIIQVWTVSIHDGIYIVTHPAINSSAHHTIHHLEFNYNYGQYFTLWDRIGGSYKFPEYEYANNLWIDKVKEKRGARFVEKEQ